MVPASELSMICRAQYQESREAVGIYWKFI